MIKFFLGAIIALALIGGAIKFESLSFDEALSRGLKIMDTTAFTLSHENNLPIIVFDMDTPGNLEKVLSGEPIGTVVHN